MREIFIEIIQIMKNDYSGWQDKLGWDDPDTFLREVEELEKKGDLSQEEFTRIVLNYLLDFNDGHILFKNYPLLPYLMPEEGVELKDSDEELYLVVLHQIPKDRSIFCKNNYSMLEVKTSL